MAEIWKVSRYLIVDQSVSLSLRGGSQILGRTLAARPKPISFKLISQMASSIIATLSDPEKRCKDSSSTE